MNIISNPVSGEQIPDLIMDPVTITIRGYPLRSGLSSVPVSKINESIIGICLQQAQANLLAHPEAMFTLNDPAFEPAA